MCSAVVHAALYMEHGGCKWCHHPQTRSYQCWCSCWSGSATRSGQVDGPFLANRSRQCECEFPVKNTPVITSLNQRWDRRYGHVHADRLDLSCSCLHSCLQPQMKRWPHTLFLFSVGGVSALSIYTILFLKLYSYKDVNLWCRELSTIKVKKLSRSLSCKFTCTLSLKEKKKPRGILGGHWHPYWITQ